jgi:signal transduction histidine kinase
MTQSPSRRAASGREPGLLGKPNRNGTALPGSRRAATVLLDRANSSLRRRTLQLTRANLKMGVEIVQRKLAQRSLRKSELHLRSMLLSAHKMQQKLKHMAHQILTAQEQERKAISRELHDEIVQTLTGINVQLATLKIEAGLNGKDVDKNISNTQKLVERSVKIVHRFARDLRPTVLDDLGLIPALESYMKAFSERTGLHIRFTAFAGIEKLSNDRRTILYRVALAALANIAQHAEAGVASVTIEEIGASIRMVIADDGKSFDVGYVANSRNNKKLGLIGMQERVEMIGGNFRIASTPGTGTTITVQIPFKRRIGAQTH